MHWIYDVSTPLVALLLVGLAVMYSAGMVLLARRLAWRLTPDDNGTAAALHAFIGVLYAIALGLMVVNAQQDYGDVEQAVVSEANATGDLFRVLAGLEPPHRDSLQHDLQRYVASVILREWPATQHARVSVETWGAIDHLANEIYTFRPADAQEERVYPQMVNEIEEVLDARRLRLFLGQQGVGEVTWIIIMLGGMITLGFAAFFRMQSLRAQLLLTGMMGAMFGLMLTLLVSMDHPLWGRVSVDPGPFRQLVVNWERIHPQPSATPPLATP